MNRCFLLVVVLALVGALPLYAADPSAPLVPGSGLDLGPSVVIGSAPAPALRRPRANMISLFDGRTLDGWIQLPADNWTVKDGVMASKGVGRGTIYTKNDYTRYRLIFTMRHVSGNPDHQACMLMFCTRPTQDVKPLDALGGIQFQVPKGGHWDYRPGFNKGGTGFTSPAKSTVDIHKWSQVEILVDATKGTADGGRPAGRQQGRRDPGLQESRSRQDRPHRLADA